MERFSVGHGFPFTADYNQASFIEDGYEHVEHLKLMTEDEWNYSKTVIWRRLRMRSQ